MGEEAVLPTSFGVIVIIALLFVAAVPFVMTLAERADRRAERHA